MKPGELVFSGVEKNFRIRGARSNRHETLKGLLFGKRAPKIPARDFPALKKLDLNVRPGEVLALIGPNGSGKSTFLKLASGILQPTAGNISREGRVTALIELGAGFHPEITGRENVIINGMLLGLSRKEIEARMEQIVKFAEIGEFIDFPVKTYSSGMYVRLGFSVAVAVEPDILLIDEVLAVGDEVFTIRCMDHLARMRRRGVTMILVTHDLDLASAFADRAIYLDSGVLQDDGPADSVVARYRSDVAGEVHNTEVHDTATKRAPVRIVEPGRRWGNGEVEILAVQTFSGGRRTGLIPSGEDCEIAIDYRCLEAKEDFVFGIAWHTAEGTLIAGHNTNIDALVTRILSGEGAVRCRYPHIPLAAGSYTLDIAIHGADGLAYDYWRRAVSLKITSPVSYPGTWAPPHRWSSSEPIWK